MENEWLDLAYINFSKVIMHGQIVKDGKWIPELNRHDIVTVQIEQVLTQEQKELVEDLNYEHEREMRKLLKSFINA